ncbi:protein phosphatase 2C domain-containing protein [Pelomonas sp. SE-A7]|uniref:PP2C family protein-serine/threonine phosphatase n=1 Tax=Pelomonas sp. SE-A7 TaxID=3054953 RepID=UPI00259CB55C|nr:protein phosphatase 2C domain-containing protein [Pelomonas sp. SE-A7]MDM4764729.1 protein phosphatase 2C domain-containing protein [Pelomonas sp. SE-A7]
MDSQSAPLTDSLRDVGALPALELAMLSRRGGRDHNEDACSHWHSERHLCVVVADGAGGHGGGDIASQLAVSHVIEQFSKAPVSEPEQVGDLLFGANEAILKNRERSGARAQMYTTVVCLLINFERAEALWGHVGDSRLYRFRGGKLLERTRDHSLMQSLVDAGLLTPEQTRNHPRRSELLSALGSEPEHLVLSSSEKAWPLQTGDAFLLCTDGVWEYVDDDAMALSLAAAATPLAWLKLIEQTVLSQAAAAGKARHDNFSAVAVWIGAPKNS